MIIIIIKPRVWLSFFFSFFLCGQSEEEKEEKEGVCRVLAKCGEGAKCKGLSLCVCVCFVLELIHAHTLDLRFCFSLKCSHTTNLGRLVECTFVWPSYLTSNICQTNGNE